MAFSYCFNFIKQTEALYKDEASFSLISAAFYIDLWLFIIFSIIITVSFIKVTHMYPPCVY